MTQLHHSWAWTQAMLHPTTGILAYPYLLQAFLEVASAWMSINRQMNHGNVVCILNGILLSHKEK
jgi:putative effector of murein hydrolase